MIILECKRCGCPETEVIKEPAPDSWFDSGKAQCENCGNVFFFRSEESQEAEAENEIDKSMGDAVVYRPVRCPDCNSSDVPVKHTEGRIRYHKCRVCNKNFKSVEK